MRLADYLYSIDDNHEVHNSRETGTPWHIAPHAEGAQYMQCNTFKGVGQLCYETVVSEHRGDADVVDELLKIETAVLPKVTWLRVYGEAADMPVRPESLQVLASRASGVPIPAGY